MNIGDEFFMIIYEHPADDCRLPHVFFYNTQQEATGSAGGYTKECSLDIVRGVIVAERVDGQTLVVVQPA